MNKKRIYLILGIMSLLLTYGICIQVKTVGNFGIPISGNSEQNELKEEILKIKERYDNLYKEYEKINNQLELERTNATQNNTELETLENEIKELNKLVGSTDITGTGVKIILKDSTYNSANYIFR